MVSKVFALFFAIHCAQIRADVYVSITVELEQFKGVGSMATNVQCFSVLEVCTCDRKPFQCAVNCNPEHSADYCNFGFFVNLLSLTTGQPVANTQNYYIDAFETGSTVKFNSSQTLASWTNPQSFTLQKSWANPQSFTLKTAELNNGLLLHLVVVNQNGYPHDVLQYAETFLLHIDQSSSRGTVNIGGIQNSQNKATVNVAVNGAGDTTSTAGTSPSTTTMIPSTTPSPSPSTTSTAYNSTTITSPVVTQIVSQRSYEIALWIVLAFAIIELIVIIVILVICIRQRRSWKESMRTPRLLARNKAWDSEERRDSGPRSSGHMPTIAVIGQNGDH